MNTEGTGFYTCKECHTTESLSKHTTTIHKEREQSGDQRNVGENTCNSGDGTGQMAQPLMFMMMMIIIIIIIIIILVITYMQGINNYIPETNHVSTVYSVAAVLYIQFMLYVMLFHP